MSFIGLDKGPRRGDWIQTFSGRQFWPLDPQPQDVSVVDIAAALSKDCRYGGHCLRFYSVAEHCVVMARHAAALGLPLRDRRSVLMHDASDAYLRDMTRPVKRAFADFCDAENKVMHVIAGVLDFDWPMPDHLKILDEALGLTEMGQIMAPPPAVWTTYEQTKSIDVDLPCWPPDVAMSEFLRECAAVAVKM